LAAVIRVKICGVNSEAAFDAAAEAGADWVGFVFFAGSPRAVTPGVAAGLSGRLRGGPGRVGLFVEPEDAAIEAALGALPLDALQLYTSPERVAAIAKRFGVPVWRAVGVAGAADLPAAAGAAAALLIEPRAAAGAPRPGGNGIVFNWGLLRGWRPGFDWLLAGGLTPANVGAAIAVSGAGAVDVSSGVESTEGVKSPDKAGGFGGSGFAPPNLN
jgi:phosphoribosylanthranilate isomerase